MKEKNRYELFPQIDMVQKLTFGLHIITKRISKRKSMFMHAEHNIYEYYMRICAYYMK